MQLLLLSLLSGDVVSSYVEHVGVEKLLIAFSRLFSCCMICVAVYVVAEMVDVEERVKLVEPIVLTWNILIEKSFYILKRVIIRNSQRNCFRKLIYTYAWADVSLFDVHDVQNNEAKKSSCQSYASNDHLNKSTQMLYK